MIDDTLAMHDRGELTREEVFAQLARVLSPSNVGSIQRIVRERGWSAAFAPWLESLRSKQQFMVAGRYESPSKDAVRAAALAHDASAEFDLRFESLPLAFRDADAHDRLPREAA